MKYKGPERRAYARILKAFSLECKFLKKGPRYALTTKNVSGGGLKLPFKRKLKSNTRLKLELSLSGTTKKIILDGRVIWAKANPRNKELPYILGIRFININLDNQTMLSNYLQYLDRNKILKESKNA